LPIFELQGELSVPPFSAPKTFVRENRHVLPELLRQRVYYLPFGKLLDLWGLASMENSGLATMGARVTLLPARGNHAAVQGR